MLQAFKPEPNPRGGYQGSKTLLSFDVGLAMHADGRLYHHTSEADTVARLERVLDAS